jgi:hypothetical protein
MKTLDTKFIKKAHEVMALAFGMTVVAIKRSMHYGSGMQFDLIFDLPVIDDRIDLEDMEYFERCCPAIIKDNESGDIKFMIDCFPISINELSEEEVNEFYKGLTKIKRRLKKLGF